MADKYIEIAVTDNVVALRTADDRQTSGPFVLQEPLSEVVSVLHEVIREGRYGEQDASRLLGRILYCALLSDERPEADKPSPRELFETVVGELESGDPSLVVRLKFDTVELDEMPWEYLYCPRLNLDLATARRLVLTRFRSGGDGHDPHEGPLKVWFVTCHPRDVLDEVVAEYRDKETSRIRATRLDVERLGEVEVAGLEEHLGQMHKVKLEVTQPSKEPAVVTTDSLEDMLEEWSPDVVHYIGHGKLPPGEGPKIALLKEDGESADWRTAKDFADLFKEWQPRLVVLHLCQGPLNSFRVSFQAFAPELLRNGVEAVVAMQYPLARDVAETFIRKFYADLSSGKSVDMAVQRGRKTMWRANRAGRYYRDFAAPMLYMHGAGVGSALVVPSSSPAPEVREGLAYDGEQRLDEIERGDEEKHTGQGPDDRVEPERPGLPDAPPPSVKIIDPAPVDDTTEDDAKGSRSS